MEVLNTAVELHLIVSAERTSCDLLCIPSGLFLSGKELISLWGIASTMTEENYSIVKCISSFSPVLYSCFDPEIQGVSPKLLCCFRVIDPGESG